MITLGLKDLALCAVIFSPFSSALAQTQFISLGYLDNFGPTSEANAIARDGTKVVGYSTTSLTENLACWWTTNGIAPVPGVQNWLANAAYAISADGSVIVGDRSFGGTEEAWYWTPDGETQAIPFPDTLRASTARGVTGDGKSIIGTATVLLNGAKYYKAFHWDRGQAKAAYLPLYSSTFPNCGAFAVSDDGLRIVGDVQTSLSTQAAAKWDGQTAPALLSQTGDPVIAVGARGITPDGSIIVGTGVQSATGKNVAFKWMAATRAVALPNPSDGRYAIAGAIATAISGNGRVIVGYGQNVAGDDEAIFWVDEEPHRVSAVAIGMGVLPDQWEPFRAYGTDYFGNMICGYGRATSGKLEAYLLVLDGTPTPPPVVAPPLQFSFDRGRGLTIRYPTVPGLRYRVHGGQNIQFLAPLHDWRAGLGIDQEFMTSTVSGNITRFFLRLEVASR